MTADGISLRPAQQPDLDRIEPLLAEHDLPHQDVRAKREVFSLAYAGETFVGVGGVERHGSHGLLRSVLIRTEFRGRGYGTALVADLEAEARRDGVTTLYLLTTTASPFFRGRGYEPVDRDRVPAAIRRTTEFSEYCPASATCLKRDLRE